MIEECSYCETPTQTHDKHSVCPRCENSGFDGQGEFSVGGTRMYRKHCWNCGLTFAVEVEE
jgi:hypothetical protein